MTSCWCRREKEDLLLRLRVQPRADRDEFVASMGDALKVKITAPPVEGKANAHLVRLLAKSFGVSRSAITLVNGEKSRTKDFRIHAPTRFPSLAENQGDDQATLNMCFHSKK